MAYVTLEEGLSLLLGVLFFVIVAGILVIFLLSSTNRMEEQTFLDSVTELQYGMDYVCTTGQTQYVDVRFPQQVTDASNWIAGLGDPKYMVYFERFPVGEEWSWATLRFTNPMVVTSEALLIGVATAAVPSGLSAAGNMFKSLKAGGYLSRIFKGADAGEEALAASSKIEASVMKTEASFAGDEVVAGLEVESQKGSSFLGRIEDSISSLKSYFTGKGIDSVEKAKAINKIFQSEEYLGAAESSLSEIQMAIDSNTAVTPQTLNVITMSEKSFGDPDKASKVASYIRSNPGSFGDLEQEMSIYATNLEKNNAFMLGQLDDATLGGMGVSNDDLKAFFRSYEEIYKGLNYVQLPRNIILPAVAGKGTWVVNTYVFDNLLSPFDRANEKFRTCGAKSLCAKTPNYIAVFPLSKCDANGVEYVRLNIKKSASITNLGLLDVIPTTWVRYLTNENKRFYLASPCGMRFEIKKDKCTCHSTQEPVFRLNYVQDSNGEWGFQSESAGYMRICDEDIGEDAGGYPTAAGRGGTEQVDCLVVTPTDTRLDGYGSGQTYHNFCASLPESYMKAADTGLLTASILIDIGITAGSGGWGGFLISVANNLVYTVASSQQYAAFLWPSGGMG